MPRDLPVLRVVHANIQPGLNPRDPINRGTYHAAHRLPLAGVPRDLEL